MDRRREIRLEIDEDVLLTVLGGPEVSIAARTLDFSGRGLKLATSVALPPESPVKIEMDDGLMLGEVCYCEPHEGGFAIGVQVGQMLTGLRDLARLNGRLMEGWRPPAAAAPVASPALSPVLSKDQRAARTGDQDWEFRQRKRVPV